MQGHRHEWQVSLLVRLWVEIKHMTTSYWDAVSASLWGCELKYWFQFRLYITYTSASLWGCELKCTPDVSILVSISQPPCEAVSWNTTMSDKVNEFAVSLLVRLWVEIKVIGRKDISMASASLWGCELKLQGGAYCLCERASASLWGCELKFEHSS